MSFKPVRALDAPYIGQVVMETPNVITVFGQGDDRYDILKSEILSTKDSSILIGLPLYEIARRYQRSREAALPVSSKSRTQKKAARQGRKQQKNLRPKPLVGKKVKSRDGDFVGHVIVESDKNIIVHGHHHYRFDIPRSKIRQADKDVVLSHIYDAVFKYSKPGNTPLPKVRVAFSQ